MNREQFRIYVNYFIIAIVSIFSCAFLPMIGSTVGLSWNLPSNTVEWIVWITTKVIVGVINMILFYCFMEQAKINVRNDERYIKANTILDRIRSREIKPKGPHRWQAGQYGVKGTTIFITSALSTFALTQAILSYDIISLITYLFTITMGIIFGILQMRKAELYWTDEYYMYALQKQDEKECVEKNDNNTRQNLQESTGTSPGE